MNNEMKRWGRRLGVVLGVVALITIAFYLSPSMKISESMFDRYARILELGMFLLLPALTITDAVKMWKETKLNGK